MSTIHRTTDLPVSPARAWALVGRPESICEWHPAIDRSDVDGTTRTCVLGNGARLTEEIRHHDDAAHSYTYVITDGPLPVKDYASTVRIVGLGDDRCRMEWSCSYVPLAPEDEVAAMITGVYDVGLQAVAASLGG